jgi:hypothetical protein
MRIILAAANQMRGGRDLKIQDVTLISSDAVGDFLHELLGSSFFAGPFGQ